MLDRDSGLALLPDQVLERRAAERPARTREAALPYRPDIDGLRGVAVGLVIAYHAFPAVRTGGFVGVDVFFVISGYLITQLVAIGLQAGTFSLAVFYQRRVRRIAPALLVVLAACSSFGWLTLLPGELQELGRSLSWSAAFLANMFFAGTGGYFTRAAELNPLLHLWSLGVEEQFYLTWPVLLLVAARRGVMLSVLGAVIMSSLAISVWGGWYQPTLHFYLPASRAWELAAGGMLAAWQLSAPARFVSGAPSDSFVARSGARVSSLLGLALIVAGGVCWTADEAVPGVWSVIPTAGALLVIGAGPLPPLNRWLLGSRLLTFVGRLSYPLYLWHWPAISFARIILGRAPRPIPATAAVAMAFGAAYVTYRVVEVPIRFGGLGRRVVPGLLAGLAIFALLGAAVCVRWIPGRLVGPTFTAWDTAVGDWHYPAESERDGRSTFTTVVVAGRHDRKTLFVGDSHVQQYWPRIASVIQSHPDTARSAVFATHSGCPPLPGVDNPRPGHHCSALFVYAMERALQPDVDTVVFGGFWEEYLRGEFASVNSRQPIYSSTDPRRGPLALESAGTRVAFEQFERTVAELIAGGRRVFIVLSNPTSPLFAPLFPPARRLSPQVPGTFALARGPDVDAAPFESFVAPVTRRLRDVASHTGAQVIDPRSSLCVGMVCPSSGPDNLPLYLDSNHLRASAARERASFIDVVLLDRAEQPRTAASL